jgi:competence protein ComGF
LKGVGIRKKMVKQSSGFTLIEMLITLSCFLIIVSFFPVLLNVKWFKEYQSERFNPLEWQLFARQVTVEIREAKEIELKNRTVHLYKVNGEKVSFEKYGNLIRRRVNGQGHEIILQYISDVHYKLEDNGLRIEVVTEQGKLYETFIMTFFPPRVKVR